MRLAALVAAAVIALTQDRAPNTAAGVRVRLHHLHFHTDDFAAAITEAARIPGGTRSMLPGLGPGVRVDDVYLLFDRPAPEAPDSSQRRPAQTIAERLTIAADWLRARGIDVTVSDAVRKLTDPPPAEPALDHVAFAADDVASIERALQGRGAEPSRRGADSVFYRAGDELVEITSETERPDAFWCPMHPNVRASRAAKCPICAMDLVPIAPPRAGEYRMDVVQLRAARGRGLDGLRLRIRDPQTGTDVPLFAETHERLLHLFIVGRDLDYFSHAHPERSDSGFELRQPLPAGAYMLIADFIPGGGYPQMVHRAIVTPGHPASPFAVRPRLDEDLSDKIVEGLKMQLRVNQLPGRPEAVLQLHAEEAVTGAPVNDLQLYLGSSGHLLIVSPDLTHSVHAHPEGSSSGPDVDFRVLFPEPGIYKLWMQVQRGGRVLTAPFAVLIRE